MGAACRCCLDSNRLLSPVPAWGGDQTRGGLQSRSNQLLVQPHDCAGMELLTLCADLGGQKDLEPGRS